MERSKEIYMDRGRDRKIDSQIEEETEKLTIDNVTDLARETLVTNTVDRDLDKALQQVDLIQLTNTDIQVDRENRRQIYNKWYRSHISLVQCRSNHDH